MQRLAWRGQISNLRVNIEFLKMGDDNDHGRFQAKRVDELKNFLTQQGIQCSGKKKDELVDLAAQAVGKYEPLEACDHKESERKRRHIVENDGTMSTFTQDAMRQIALLGSAV